VETCGGKPEIARTSAFFGSVTPKAFCQKRLKLSFPAPFFFGSFLFGRTKRNEHKRGCPFKEKNPIAYEFKYFHLYPSCREMTQHFYI
jgi:hypothetical protein